ncbi:hypothetical protein HY086_02515 [Candidatus Gottesmanbacteria bacterium]|nr:hypothetical protein [Candidatus Gottesmanbacteria bacterium]
MRDLIFLGGVVTAIVGLIDVFFTAFTFAKYNPHSFLATAARWVIETLAQTPRELGVPIIVAVIGIVVMMIALAYPKSPKNNLHSPAP